MKGHLINFLVMAAAAFVGYKLAQKITIPGIG